MATKRATKSPTTVLSMKTIRKENICWSVHHRSTLGERGERGGRASGTIRGKVGGASLNVKRGHVGVGRASVHVNSGHVGVGGASVKAKSGRLRVSTFQTGNVGNLTGNQTRDKGKEPRNARNLTTDNRQAHVGPRSSQFCNSPKRQLPLATTCQTPEAAAVTLPAKRKPRLLEC